MKKSTKIGLGLTTLLLGAMVLTGCTNSFCSSKDKAHILYAIDHGVCEYFATEDEAKGYNAQGEIGKLDADITTNEVWYNASLDNSKGLSKIHDAALNKQFLAAPSLAYYIELDNVVLKHAIEAANITDKKLTADDISYMKKEGDKYVLNKESVLGKFGYLKYYGNNEKDSKKLWENWDAYTNEVRLSEKVAIDECPTTDYITFYQNQMKNNIAGYRSCLAISNGYYGNYGDGVQVEIEAKDWGYAWQRVGFLSGLLVYPIGWLTDTIAVGFAKGGMAQGWASLLAILFVTIIVRTLMLAATFKQTTSSNKMQELQPEIAKIQAKYPNSNTNNYEKQRLAAETQALYKKHKINPFTSILVMIVQFPVFICVWGAMQGSAILSTGRVLGLNLSQSISSVLTTWSNWKDPASGVWTALVLFLLMAGAQTVAMLLPQWIAKAKKKKIAKLGRNPAQKESDNKMKWFTYIMLAMIIFMGFSLVSALGVYWLVGALFSIAQTLITHAIMNRKGSKKQ